MDWNQPALPLAVDYFERHYLEASRQRFDMDQILVVVPGSRAGRRLLQLLALRARERKAVLFPPQIETAGSLPEHLYEPQRPFADELTQHLVWVESIKKWQSKARKYFPHLPPSEETIDWLDMAALLARIHRELAADGLDFGDVEKQGQQVRGFSEAKRWRFLRTLQRTYLELLDALQLWDMQTARLYAIKHQECRTDLSIYLLATADLNQATRQMLQQVGSRVTALIHAPESEALGFDEFGCLVPDYWRDHPVPISSEQVIVTDQPADQAEAVCYCLGQLPQPLDADHVVVGVPAHETALDIQRLLHGYGIESHWSVGRSLAGSGPARFLEAIQSVLELDGYPEYATLFRHPDTESWLEHLAENISGVEASDVIAEADAYYAEHLVPGFGVWLGDRRQRASLQWAVENIQRLLKPLRKKSLRLSAWGEPILTLLGEVYEHQQFDLENPDDHLTIQALKRIRQHLESLLDLPEPLEIKTDAINILRLILQKLGQETVAQPPAANAIELLGWLELPLDVADHVILTSFNEGVIPESVNSDMFLPNRLRKALGLIDNERRYARDAYAVSSLVHSKRELRIIIGKRNLAGDPLMPSRIFFATDRETIANRVLQFSQPIDFVEPQAPADTRSESDFLVPYPRVDDREIQSISVTSFKAYLQCPYRFYLGHVLRLRQVDDSDRELNALAFGNLLHDLFHRFGESRQRFSEDEQEIREYLQSELNDLVASKLGSRHLPAVEIQLEQMRQRVDGFAQWQAGRTRDGWEIHYVEKKPLDPGGFDFELEPGRSVKLRGSIDRIDYHKETDTWQILDYKTGERGDTPGRSHQEKGEWVDLQLPLYRLIAEEFDVQGNVQLGYILIPKSASDIGAVLADWSDEQLAEAWELARECARNIVDLKFWEPVYTARQLGGSEFAPICQDDVFDPRLEPPPSSQTTTGQGAAS